MRTQTPLLDEAEAAACEDHDSRVRYLSSLMARGRFVPGITKAQLALVWHLAEKQVSVVAREASDYLASQLADGSDADGYNLRREAELTMRDIRVTALCEFERLKEQDPGYAQKFLATSLDSAKALAALIPEGNSTEDVVVLRVEMVAPERPSGGT